MSMQAQPPTEELDEAEHLLLIQIQKMINLDIPLHLSSENLDDVDRIAKLNKTWIEKIAERTQTPLVAGVSGSMGRLLIALIHFKLIKPSNDALDELQILANCVAAHMAFQGHHSFEEVHEASRRAIDALLLIDALKDGDVITVDNDFYKVGSNVFLHPSYANKVMEDAKASIHIAQEMAYHY